jgi:acyl-CoA dehydrogenase
MYSSLARGAVEALLVHGTNEQKATYVPKMLAGQWGGTMNLTEPHSGTDLGMMRSRAVKQTNDSYKISGTKIFISGGEQDLTENIIHLVLAKIEGGPPGIKGVSLFLVPKILLNNDGSLGERNSVSCASIEHKMGIRGSSTCVLNFEDATGWLVGSEHKGMEAMFVMMNEARLGTGVQGLAQSEIAYQNAVAYARDRLQGRALTGAVAPEKPADPIIVHPDVRRTLMTIRAFNEGARALVMWTSLKGDVASRSDDAQERQQAHNDMSLLTPMIKGFLTDRGFASTVSAQQLFGGHGYIVETGVEQFVRDARITMLYEGANGIQALDLVARKLPKDGGRSMTLFCDEIEALIADNKSNETLRPYIAPLATAVNHLRQATVFILNNAVGNPNNAAAASTDYLQLFGLVALGYMWAQIAITASDKISDGDTNTFLQTKLVTGAFYAETSLLESAVLLARIQNGAARIMELTADAF